MNLQPYYEDSFKTERTRTAADLLSEVLTSSKGLYNYVLESKDRFLKDRDWSTIKVLELGAGRGGVSLQLAKLGAHVTLVDFSPSAVEQGRKIFQHENQEAEFVVGDVTHPDLILPHKFDLIIDSHLLHCLTEDPDRVSYFGLVHDHLERNGIFVCESMAYRKKLFVPDGFMLDERKVLWQMFGKWTPVRRILDSLDLEHELISAGFNIAYFFYYGQYSFVPHRSFMDVPAEILPAAVRMVLQLKPE
jgi:SAM-dependent methyltransferase